MKRTTCPVCGSTLTGGGYCGKDEQDRPVRCATLATKAGAILTAAREHSGRSRADLARELAVAPNTLRELEHGQANVTLDRLDAVLAVYGVDVALASTFDRRPLPGTRTTRPTTRRTSTR